MSDKDSSRGITVPVYLADGRSASDAMIDAVAEIIHTMYASPGELDRHNSRYAAERVFMAMMTVLVYEALYDSSEPASDLKQPATRPK